MLTKKMLKDSITWYSTSRSQIRTIICKNRSLHWSSLKVHAIHWLETHIGPARDSLISSHHANMSVAEKIDYLSQTGREAY